LINQQLVLIVLITLFPVQFVSVSINLRQFRSVFLLFHQLLYLISCFFFSTTVKTIKITFFPSYTSLYLVSIPSPPSPILTPPSFSTLRAESSQINGASSALPKSYIKAYHVILISYYKKVIFNIVYITKPLYNIWKCKIKVNLLYAYKKDSNIR